MCSLGGVAAYRGEKVYVANYSNTACRFSAPAANPGEWSIHGSSYSLSLDPRVIELDRLGAHRSQIFQRCPAVKIAAHPEPVEG